MFVLRDYQSDAMVDIRAFLKTKYETGIVIQPTAAGKSILVANTIMEVGKAIVIQPNKELLMQNFNKYKAYGYRASIFSASLGVKNISDVTFATIGSIKNYPYLFKELGVTTMIIDECHMGTKSGQMIDKFIEEAGIKKVIGFTATPVELRSSLEFGSVTVMMHRSKGNLFSRIIHTTQISKLVQDGHWAPLFYFNRPQDRSALVLNSSGSDFTDASVRKYYAQNDMGDKIYLACQWGLETRKCKRVLVFVSLVEHARTLERRIPGSKAVYGDMDPYERDKAIADFKSGKLKIIFNVNVLGTGFDDPELDCIIHARPTNSVTLWYQHIGRAVRPFPGKKALIVDLSGNLDRFGRPEELIFMEHWNKKIGWGMFSGNKLLTGYYNTGDLSGSDKIIKARPTVYS